MGAVSRLVYIVIFISLVVYIVQKVLRGVLDPEVHVNGIEKKKNSVREMHQISYFPE